MTNLKDKIFQDHTASPDGPLTGFQKLVWEKIVEKEKRNATGRKTERRNKDPLLSKLTGTTFSKSLY